MTFVTFLCRTEGAGRCRAPLRALAFLSLSGFLLAAGCASRPGSGSQNPGAARDRNNPDYGLSGSQSSTPGSGVGTLAPAVRPESSHGDGAGTGRAITPASKSEAPTPDWAVDIEFTVEIERDGDAGSSGKPTATSRSSVTSKVRASPGEPVTISGLSRETEISSPRGASVATKESLTFKVLPQNVTDDTARVQFLVVRESGGVETTLAAPVLESAMGERAVLEQKGRDEGKGGGLVNLRVSMKPSLPKDR